jgi:hypothetical protein
VKRLRADDSAATSVKVGNRQACYSQTPQLYVAGAFCFVSRVFGIFPYGQAPAYYLSITDLGNIRISVNGSGTALLLSSNVSASIAPYSLMKSLPRR